MRQEITVISFHKRKEGAPWRISFFLNGTSMSSVLGKDGAIIGSKLAVRLQEAEKNVIEYPFEISYNHIGDSKQRSATATAVERAVSYIECNVGLYKNFHKGKIQQNLSFLENPFNSDTSSQIEPAIEASAFSAMDYASEDLQNAGVNGYYIIIGKPHLTMGTDGDTVTIIPEYIGKQAKAQGVTTSPVGIRYIGVQSPETNKEGTSFEDYSNIRNAAYAQYFSVTVPDAYVIAEESKAMNRKLLGANESRGEDQIGDNYILVHLDRDASGSLGYSHDRIAGVLYQTNMSSLDKVLKAFESGTAAFRNINKTMLKEKSKKFSPAPLAYMEYDNVYNNYSNTVLNPILWANELGLRIFDPGTNNNPKGVSPSILPDIETNPQDDNSDISGVVENSVAIDFTEDYISNVLDFVKPDDDRFDEIFKYKDDVQYQQDSRVRIGDVLLTIPPLSISVDHSSSIQKVKTIRTKSSIMTKTGSTTTTLQMELYFHDVENINGIERKTGDYTFYMDGLRTLIAQFAKCPFVPIDNPYINNVLGVHSVALMDLSISTVPGFPHSITASITLAKFDSAAYMPDTPFLGEAINYPLMRWFYQQNLMFHESIAGRTFYKPIDGTLTNDFTFQIANRTMLEARANAFKSINSMDTPEKMREDASKGMNEIGIILEDAKRASAIIEKYNKYQKIKSDMAGYSVIESGEDIVDIKSLYTDKYNLKNDEYENAITEAKSFYKSIYGSKVSLKGTEVFFFETPVFYEQRFGKRPRSEYSDGHGTQAAGPTDWPIIPQNITENEILKMDSLAGYVQIGLSAAVHMGDLPDHWKIGKKIDGVTGYYIPLTQNGLSKLKKIAGNKEEANNSLDDYEEGYRQLEQIINSTENDLKLEDYNISGMIPTSLNVMYGNQFATLPVLETATPTLQYLGSQDPYVQMTFEVSDTGLQQVRELLDRVDEYSRVFRQGISTGFLGVKNQLTELFGIQTVMVESARFATVPNFPGRNQVQMTLVGFNKTQRRAESIAGFNGTLAGTKLKDIENNEGQANSDAIVELRLKKMEVYPDLELPTYEELNKAINNLGLKIPEYINRTGALFVDPDFYVATPWTFRDSIKKDYMGDHTLFLKDASGLQMQTSASSERIIDGDEDNWEIINNLSTSTSRVESMFKWGSNSSTEADMNNDGIKEPVSYKDSRIVDYMTKPDDKGVSPYQVKPSFEEWKEWNDGTKKEYDKWKEKKNPTEKEVYDYMYKKMVEYFSEFKLSGADFVKKKTLSKKQLKTAYSGSQAFYAVTYQLIKDELSEKELKALKKRTSSANGNPAEFKEPKIDKDKVSEKDYESVSNRIPFERVFGMIKALFHFSSKWKQFSNKGAPLVDAAYNSCGIAGVPLADNASTISEAQRLLWDWKYNVDTGMNALYEFYKTCEKADPVKQIEFLARPWETIIYNYANGKFPESSSSMDTDGTLNSVLDIFNKVYVKEGRWASPTAVINIDIYSSSLGLTKREKRFASGEATKDDYIDAIVDDLAWFYKFKEIEKTSHYKKWKESDESGWLDVFASKEFAKMTKLMLGDLSKAQVMKKFHSIIKEMKEDEDWNKDHPFLGFFEDIWDGAVNLIDGQYETTETGEELVEVIGSYGEAIDNSINNRLTGDEDPEQLYREMYTDLIKYDHRGRLLRAFPAFQMLIIDEGKWMGRFKFWDNMYEFNSIESIDVYKSRKIAADTAIIRMTNVYSNLTTRRVDLNYQDRKTDFWNNLVFENPTEELLDTRSELLTQMQLETGARIHLRMGYGSDASALPIMFNGTVTELDTQEVIEIVCQGDGVELGNVVSGDPDDDNGGFFKVTEPRDLICELMTSKGSWFNDVVNNLSDGRFMRNNPLGIMHFGVPGELAPPGTLNWYNTDYGEAAQNIYSSNGTPTFSQWTHPDGSDRKLLSGSVWHNIATTSITNWFQPGDEDNIIVKFYNNTTWDIIQTLAYCSLDYIVAVHPFETRSTLFFGKPYWRMAHAYSSKYEWDESEKEWVRNVNIEHRKPYMQFRYYDSHQDIIQNAIKVSEDGIFTNVIVNYDGEQTPILSADYDIRFDKQKTQVVDAEIVARFHGNDYWTSEHQARNFGMSTLRDSMKDMYKGSLTVVGDPSVKPHDAMYLSDFTSTMNGICLVKSVTHHLSVETGFITSIEPDAYVMNDDLVMVSIASWFSSHAAGISALILGRVAAMRAISRVQQSKTIGKLLNSAKGNYNKLVEKAVKVMLESMAGNNEPAFQAYKKAFDTVHNLPKDASKATKKTAYDALDRASEGLNKYVDEMESMYKDKKKFLKFFNADAGKAKESFAQARFLARKSKAISAGLRLGSASSALVLKSSTQVAKAAFAATGVGFIIEVGVSIATEGIFEMYSRYKEALQCVTMIPLRYRGKEMTAGINGHQGMVVGDNPGKLDKLVSAQFGKDETDEDADYINWVFETMNFLSGSDKSYSVSQDELSKTP